MVCSGLGLRVLSCVSEYINVNGKQPTVECIGARFTSKTDYLLEKEFNVHPSIRCDISGIMTKPYRMMITKSGNPCCRNMCVIRRKKCDEILLVHDFRVQR